METKWHLYIGPRNNLAFQFGQAYELRYAHLPDDDVAVALDHLQPAQEAARLSVQQFETWFEPIPTK